MNSWKGIGYNCSEYSKKKIAWKKFKFLGNNNDLIEYLNYKF
jgi:hypothetical protein